MKNQKFVVNAIRQLLIDNIEQFCELVNFLVTADSMENAQNLVENFIQTQATPFINADGKTGIWQFVEILSINPIITEQPNLIELQVQIYESVKKLHESEAKRAFIYKPMI